MMPQKALVELALRNVRRNKKRTMLTFLAITVGIAAFLVSTTMINGIDETSLRNYIRSETGVLKVYDKTYYPDKKEFYLDNLISNPTELSDRLEKAYPGIKAAPRLKIRGSALLNDLEIPCLIIGADPNRDPAVFNVLKSVLPAVKNGNNTAALSEFRNGTNRCLMGVNLAKALGASLGDEILIYGRTKRAAYNADTFIVSGLISCDNPGIDAFAVILPLSSAANFADTAGSASEIAVGYPSRDNQTLNKISRILKPQLPENLEIYTWENELSDVLTVFKIRRIIQKIVISFLLILAIAGITNTMLMAVFERTKEIGTLASMGMKKKDIVRLFLYEGLIIGIIGGFAAMVVTALPVAFLVNIGIQVKGAEMLANVPISSRIYGNLPFFYYPIALALAILSSALATLYPSAKAASLNIAEILRGK